MVKDLLFPRSIFSDCALFNFSLTTAIAYPVGFPVAAVHVIVKGVMGRFLNYLLEIQFYNHNWADYYKDVALTAALLAFAVVLVH